LVFVYRFVNFPPLQTEIISAHCGVRISHEPHKNYIAVLPLDKNHAVNIDISYISFPIKNRTFEYASHTEQVEQFFSP